MSASILALLSLFAEDDPPSEENARLCWWFKKQKGCYIVYFHNPCTNDITSLPRFRPPLFISRLRLPIKKSEYFPRSLTLDSAHSFQRRTCLNMLHSSLSNREGLPDCHVAGSSSYEVNMVTRSTKPLNTAAHTAHSSLGKASARRRNLWWSASDNMGKTKNRIYTP